MSFDAPTAPFTARFVARGNTLAFGAPIAVITADAHAAVKPALAEAAAASRAGHWVAGFVAYEAAAALDAALVTHPAPADGLPLLWFGVYDAPDAAVPRPGSGAPGYTLGAWEPSMGRGEYEAAIARIREYIAAGDSYQVNYTYPLRASFAGDAAAWFDDLCAAQQADHCAYLDLGQHAIVSASPELFFHLDGGRITTRPMKGTCPRGRWAAEDTAQGAALRQSEKNRAENVMIVDLLRNDLGRLARVGSVRVDSLFDLERYPTVWQLTSSITAETGASWDEALAVLFPSGSVTGAPKVRTMQIIRTLEPHPRGAYCGAIGWAAPDGRASFNVAIRTATVDRATGTARYPVGSGITWESAAAAEYAETRDKAAVLVRRPPAFALIETMRCEDGRVALLDGHLARMGASAAYFGFPWDRGRIEGAVHEAVRGAVAESGGDARLRLLLGADGSPTVARGPLPPPKEFRVGWAPHPVNAADVFLYHKTTQRAVYDGARAAAPDCDAVLLTNTEGAVTEACIANVVAEIDGVRYTPPLACGLLGGVMREHLLAQGALTTRRLTRADIEAADRVWLINALRGWIPVAAWATGGTSEAPAAVSLKHSATRSCATQPDNEEKA